MKTLANRQNFKFWYFQPVHCCQAEILYLQRYSTDFSKSFPQLEDVYGGHLGEKFQERRYFTFASGKVKTLRIDNIWNFATFNLYTVRAKILYLQRYSTDCRNLSHSSKILTVAIWVESFRCAGILLLQWQGENFAHWQHLKFCHFQPVHCASKNPISPKVFNRFLKSLPQLEDVEGGHLGGKVSGGVGIFLLQWQGENLGASTTFQILPTFNLYTVQAEILYLQRIFNRLSKSFASARRCWRLAIWVESFRCAGISLLQWQGENFAHRQPLKFCHFQPVHCASRNPISPKIFNRLSKSFPQLEDVDGGHLGGKFQVRRYFTFAMARWKLCASTTFEILPLSTCTLCQQKSYISKGIQPIFEIFASARRFWGWAFGW